MEYNNTVRHTQYYVSEENMMLRQNASWDPEGDNGKGDSIGRTALAYIAYGDKSLMESVMFCYDKVPIIRKGKTKRFYYHGFRYPDYWKDDLSRDHVTYTMIGLKYVGASKALKEFVEGQRWRISERYTFTIDMWLWSRGIIGKRWARALYYMITIPMMSFSVLWSRALHWFGAFGEEEHQDDFVPSRPEELTATQRKVRKWMFPTYALHILGWQLTCLPGSRAKRILKRICRGWVGRHNYLLRVLFGERTEKLKEQCRTYLPMTSWRWGTRLDGTNDRACKVITDPKLTEFNALDQDILKIALNIEGMT